MKSTTRKRPTINDVARLAGVSKKTVSRVINNSGPLHNATRDRVKEVIAKLDYSPDPQARGLSSSRSYLLGIVYDNPNALYIADVQQGVLSVCREAGYELVVHPSNYEDYNIITDTLNFVRRLKLDGVVLLSPISQLQALVDALKEVNCPVARLTSKDCGDDSDRIISQDRVGVAALARHFVELGHREIGLITGPSNFWSSIEREEGFRHELIQHGIVVKPSQVRVGGYNFQSGYECGKSLLQENENLTAVFACNDEMAAGFYRAAHEYQRKIPEDISVAGFDDSPIATRISPSLTSVNQPIHDMGKMAAGKLLGFYANKDNQHVSGNIALRPELIVRASTAMYTVKE